MKKLLLYLFLLPALVFGQIDKKKAWYLLSASSSSIDSDYQAVLDRATALGYTLPSAGQQVKQNQLILDLKSAGIWSQLDLFYVFATDGDQNFSFINWKSPSTFLLTKSGTVNFTANQGNISNGTNGYLNTGWVPSTSAVNLTLNSTHVAVYVYNHVSENKYDLGTAPSFVNSTPQIYLRSDDSFGNFYHALNQNGNSTVLNGGSAVGFWMPQRKDASNTYIFKNGVQVDTEVDASTAVPSGNLFLLAVNNGGAPANYTTRRLSMFSIGASLNGLESAYYTAWNTYFTSL